jgi:hypothetical protein
VVCLQVLIFFVYQFVTNFLFESTATTCFNTTLERLRLDPRITVGGRACAAAPEPCTPPALTA